MKVRVVHIRFELFQTGGAENESVQQSAKDGLGRDVRIQPGAGAPAGIAGKMEDLFEILSERRELVDGPAAFHSNSCKSDGANKKDRDALTH